MSPLSGIGKEDRSEPGRPGGRDDATPTSEPLVPDDLAEVFLDVCQADVTIRYKNVEARHELALGRDPQVRQWTDPSPALKGW